MNGLADLLITGEHRLTPIDAVAAIITVDGNYLMQQRDPIPGIFYPGHWGLFGGGIEAGESEVETLHRELEEELSLKIPATEMRRFTSLVFDFSFAGGPDRIIRAIYEVELETSRLESIRLNEGRAVELLSPAQLLDPARPVAPFDSYALWMHINRNGFAF